jgi:hypothetical protein
MQPGESLSQRSALSPEQKQRRVVLKRVNIDRAGVRQDFLRMGTMAKGAAETGAVESYMCAKVGAPATGQSLVDKKESLLGAALAWQLGRGLPPATGARCRACMAAGQGPAASNGGSPSKSSTGPLTSTPPPYLNPGP